MFELELDIIGLKVKLVSIPVRKQFEIIVTLEGITPETGNTVQV